MFRPFRRALAITLAPLAAALPAAVLLSPVPPAAAATASPATPRAFPELESQYVRMPDGVRLAADVWLPAGTRAGAPGWIAARPWSNGRVGVTGVSYSADTAMLSLALRNPHITAAAPISYDFDPYEDLVRPGGILVGPRIAPYALLLKILDKTGGTTAAADPSSFQLLPPDGQASYLIGDSTAQPSFVELPVVR